MPSLKDFALNLLSRNPNVQNNPSQQNMINAIRNGDDAAGQQIADNLCKTYGISREEALKKAKEFFGIR